MEVKTKEIRFYPIVDGKIEDEIVIGNNTSVSIEQTFKIVEYEFFNKFKSDYKIEWIGEKPTNHEQYALSLYIGKHEMCFVPLVINEKLGGKFMTLGKYKGWFPMILCKRKNLSKLLNQYEWTC